MEENMKEKAFIFYELLNECKSLEDDDLDKVLEDVNNFTNKLIKERQSRGIELQPFCIGEEREFLTWLDGNI